MARYPHIHGYFHGGPAMEPIVTQVMQDVERRNIRLPTWAMLQAQVRSAATGEILQASSQALVQALLEHIFVDNVDWQSTWRGIQAEAAERKEQDRGNVRIVFLGPNTSPFQPNARSLTAEGGLECVTTKSLAQPQFSDDDIAIVGMSVEFPEGSGKEAFWDTLKAGRSTVRDVSIIALSTGGGIVNNTDQSNSRSHLHVSTAPPITAPKWRRSQGDVWRSNTATS